MRKDILCDSSSLISLGDACMLDVLSLFSKKYEVNFIIPKGVEKEIVERPLTIKMKAYQYSAMRLKREIEKRILVKVDIDTETEGKKLLKIANSIFFARGRPVHLIDMGEAEMIILAHKLRIRTLLMDERTTRMLIEAPFTLKEHLERELRVNVMLNKENYSYFSDYTKDMRVVRSVDLVALAYKAGYFEEKFGDESFKAFSAALYKLKYSGCSVSFEEIKNYLREIE